MNDESMTFCNLFYSLSKENSLYLTINTQLKMESISDFEDRVKYWEAIFQKQPPLMHRKTSPTWADPTLHRKTLKKASSISSSSIKEEL